MIRRQPSPTIAARRCPDGARPIENANSLAEATHRIQAEEAAIRQGGGEAGRQRQKQLGRLTARERLDLLFDPGTERLELGLWAAWRMYADWGDIPAAGILTVIGRVHDRPVMAVANDATVKAAIGQSADPEELGGAHMHAAISGTADYRAADNPACLQRLRSLVELLPTPASGYPAGPVAAERCEPQRNREDLYQIVPADGRGEYDVRDLLACVVDAGTMQEYKEEFGRTVLTAFARIGGRPVGIVANQRRRCRTDSGEIQIGGVLYGDSAEKAARFVMECNQTALPIVFFQDVQGFMVGKQAEQSGIIRRGAKLVNVVSNSVVPKLTVIVGGSFGAGSYALCGKAYDPWLIVAWPTARYAVMGAEQAADTLLQLRLRTPGHPAPGKERTQCRVPGRAVSRSRKTTSSICARPAAGDMKSRPTSATARPAAGSMPSLPRTRRETSSARSWP